MDLEAKIFNNLFRTFCFAGGLDGMKANINQNIATIFKVTINRNSFPSDGGVIKILNLL